jgi:tRNA (mo5U34)-methyltransferase
LIDFLPLITAISDTKLKRWADIMPDQIAKGLSPARWGDLNEWQAVLKALPNLKASHIELKDEVIIGLADDCALEQQAQLKDVLKGLHPWRKGPFDIFGIHLDTEWRSDWKWDRVLPHLSPLKGRTILDVGCGSGYHCLRMLGEGAHRVIGIDPSPRFVHQFYCLKHFTPELKADVLPLGIEQVPSNLKTFDTVFSMGVFYHRKSPMEHLRELRDCLKHGGELVLETLVVEGPEGFVLVPEGRYAKMNNVWFLPSPDTMLSWLRKCGFRNSRVVDMNQTSIDEQRATEWMTFESLSDFLDPEDQNKTIEGHPAPVRAVFIADAP